MSHSPKTPKDLMLAPVAVSVDENLQRLRSASSVQEVDYELQLALDRPVFENTREERAMRVLAMALRDVDLHGWAAEIADDGSAVRLSGGSVSLDIAVGAPAREYISEPLVTAA